MRILAIQNDPTDPPHLVGEWLEEQGHEIVLLKAFSGEEVPVSSRMELKLSFHWVARWVPSMITSRHG